MQPRKTHVVRILERLGVGFEPIDEAADACRVIFVSAGVCGTQILVAPADYARATRATRGPIARARGDA